MKSYQYIARDATGVRKESIQQGASKNDVLAWLRQEGLTAVCVSEVNAETKRSYQRPRRGRIQSCDLSALCWQLSTMVEGGIPITAALKVVIEDIENFQLQQVLHQILGKLLKGQTFSASLLEFPKVFNHLSCAIILAGEGSGNLADALERLALYYESCDKLKRQVVAAAAYPAFVFIFIVLIVVFVMAFIVPRFMVIFEQMKGEMPAFTMGFIRVYEILRGNIFYIIGGVGLGLTAISLIYKTQKGHYWLSRATLLIPLLGKMFKYSFVVAFCKTMSTLLASGVSVLEAFDILSTMTGNDVIKQSITRSREQIVDGTNISASLDASGFFPRMLVKMVQAGEESGTLPKVLDKTADYYERKLDSTITTLMNMLEPIMIVLVGGIVLIVVLALYLPIFSMS